MKKEKKIKRKKRGNKEKGRKIVRESTAKNETTRRKEQ